MRSAEISGSDVLGSAATWESDTMTPGSQRPTSTKLLTALNNYFELQYIRSHNHLTLENLS